jgi:hypothetical protein
MQNFSSLLEGIWPRAGEEEGRGGRAQEKEEEAAARGRSPSRPPERRPCAHRNEVVAGRWLTHGQAISA